MVLETGNGSLNNVKLRLKAFVGAGGRIFNLLVENLRYIIAKHSLHTHEALYKAL